MFIIFISSPASATDITVTTAPNASITYAEMVMSFLTSLCIPAPNRCEMSIPAPTDSPMHSVLNRYVSEPVVPTAASLSEPRNLPTMMESTML